MPKETTKSGTLSRLCEVRIALVKIPFCAIIQRAIDLPDIRVMVKNIDRNNQSNDIKKLFQTLEGCRNQDNNPDSQA